MPKLVNREPRAANIVSVPVRVETNEKLTVLSEKTGLKKYRLIDSAVDLLVESLKNRERLEKRTHKKSDT